MTPKLHIVIKKRNQPGWLMFFIVVFPFLFGICIELLRMPMAVKYLIDLAWLALAVYMLRFHRSFNPPKASALMGWVLAFFLYTFVVYVFRYQSGLYYLWGLRNNFRFYIAFFAFTVFMDQSEGDGLLALFDKLFWVQFGICMVQHFLLGYSGDFLGGLFGVETGSNGYLNMFYIIMTAKSILYCLAKKESVGKCLLKCGAALLVAALAELKFFFIEFILIVALCTLITSFSWRKLGILVASAVAVIVMAALLVKIFPFFQDVFSIDALLKMAMNDNGYTFRGDLNRLTVIPEINERFFSGPVDQIFGFGMGNCDLSTYDFLCSPFSEKYLWTHYNLFSTSFVYLEMGWIGLIFFFGFFLLHYSITTRMMKKNKCNSLHGNLARVVALLCVLVGVYNSTLRTEVGYMAYFVMALPFMYGRSTADKAYESVTDS